MEEQFVTSAKIGLNNKFHEKMPKISKTLMKFTNQHLVLVLPKI